jgi:hypothetical protein
LNNTASGYATTVGGGHKNTASGSSSTVPGGYADTAAGDYSMAAGRLVRITSDGDYTFAFGRDFTTSTPNAVIFHNSVNPIRVGIGTTSPGVDLDIASASPGLRLTGSSSGATITLDGPSGNASYLDFRSGGATKYQAGLSTTNDYYIYNWPASRYVFYATSGGNVGIGTTDPSERLHVDGGTDSAPTGGGYIVMGDVSSYNISMDDNEIMARNNGDTSTVVINFNGGNVSMCRQDGYVGIGTTTPTDKLDVDGNAIRVRTSQTPASSSADGYTGEIAWDSNYIYICVSGDGPGGGADSWKRAAISTW